jgi:mono/diheme cytochrome c family protein
MAEKPNPGGIISSLDQQRIVAYLIAITPDLQSSAQVKRQQVEQVPATSSNTDPKKLFETTCSQCHASNLSEAHNFKTNPAKVLVQRMVGNGMKTSNTDLELLIAYLTQTYVK